MKMEQIIAFEQTELNFAAGLHRFLLTSFKYMYPDRYIIKALFAMSGAGIPHYSILTHDGCVSTFCGTFDDRCVLPKFYHILAVHKNGVDIIKTFTRLSLKTTGAELVDKAIVHNILKICAEEHALNETLITKVCLTTS